MDKKNVKGEVFDFLKDLVWIVIIVVIIRSFIAEPFQISGQSMASSYYDREFIIVDRFSYLDIPAVKDANINRGDVVVFKPGVSKDKEFFIKRIIGLSGDSIKIKDGDVFLKVSGTLKFIKLDEKYLNDSNKGNTKVGYLETEHNYIVPEGNYFVMGDNRNHSSDSRTCFANSCDIVTRDSYVAKNQITGKVFLDLGYFDFSNFGFIHSGKGDFSELKGLDTSPKWFSSPSSYDYGF